MAAKRKRDFIGLLVIFYLIAALLPLLAFCSAREEPEEAAPETSQQSPAGSAVEQTGIFRIEDADGEILEVEDSEFVKGGIAAEVPPSWEPEALKAQGVALYTYYSRLREQNRAKGGDGADFTCNTEKALVYLPQEARKERWGENYETWEAALEEAEKNIRGQTLQQDGALLCSTYFAISSGSTDAAQDVWGGEYSYLQPAASPGDVFAEGYLSQKSMTEAAVKEALLKAFPNAQLGDEPESWITEVERTGSGTIRKARAGGEEATGTQLRNAFGLRSANFTWKRQDGKFIFTVKGWGHNVGMSQNGAQYMAKNGASYQEILAWYYPGSQLV